MGQLEPESCLSFRWHPYAIDPAMDLHALGKAGLVRDRKDGRERVFSLDLRRLDVARQYIDDVSAQWDAAAARLKAFVERDEG